jgi:hypothetical protein
VPVPVNCALKKTGNQHVGRRPPVSVAWPVSGPVEQFEPPESDTRGEAASARKDAGDDMHNFLFPLLSGLAHCCPLLINNSGGSLHKYCITIRVSRPGERMTNDAISTVEGSDPS